MVGSGRPAVSPTPRQPRCPSRALLPLPPEAPMPPQVYSVPPSCEKLVINSSWRHRIQEAQTPSPGMKMPKVWSNPLASVWLGAKRQGDYEVPLQPLKLSLCMGHLSQQLERSSLLLAHGAPLHRTQWRQRICSACGPGRRHRRRVPYAAGRLQHPHARQRIHLEQEAAK